MKMGKMDCNMDTLPLSKSLSSTSSPKSDCTWLEDDYDHQGETRQKAQLWSFMIHYPIQPIVTTLMPKYIYH